MSVKKPKVNVVIKGCEDGRYSAYVGLDTDLPSRYFNLGSFYDLPTRKAARERAKEWCRIVGTALLERAGRAS